MCGRVWHVVVGGLLDIGLRYCESCLENQDKYGQKSPFVGNVRKPKSSLTIRLSLNKETIATVIFLPALNKDCRSAGNDWASTFDSHPDCE